MLKNLTIFKNILLALSIILLGLFIFKIKSIILLFFVSFIVASAIDPVVELLSKKMPRKVATLMLAVLGFIIIFAFLVPFINVFIKQTLLFLNQTPIYWEKIKYLTGNISDKGWLGIIDHLGLGKWLDLARNMGVLPDVSQIMSTASTIGQSIINRSIDLSKGFLSVITSIFTITIIVLYMLMDKNDLTAKLLRLFPEKTRTRTGDISVLISKKVGGFVISQVILIFCIGLLVTVGLSLIKVDFSLILGAIAGVFEIIPVVGPIITGIIIILVALAQKPILALWAILIYIAVEWLAEILLKPFILNRFLDLHPLTLIFSLLAGAALWGIVGLILAPAIAATVCILIDELYIKRINPEEIK